MSISMRTRYEVLRRCNFSCYYCGLPAGVVTLHMDHVIPKARGGNDKQWNLVAACPPCNLGKGDSVPDEHVVHRVRNEYCAYWSSYGPGGEQCSVCRIPLESDPADDPDEAPQCMSCNAAIVDAFDAGLRYGLGKARR